MRRAAAAARLRLQRAGSTAPAAQRRHSSGAQPAAAAGDVWRGAEAIAHLQQEQEQEQQQQQQQQPDARSSTTHHRYDVVVIGAGVVGSALAMELSQYRLSVLLLDSNHDVGEGTSKANAAIVHTGFDSTPGSLESELVTSASRDWPAMAARLQIPFRECGAVMLARDEEQAGMLPDIHAKAVANGTEDCVRILSADEVRTMEPHAAPSVQGGLLVTREAVADPFTTVVAYAEVAVFNGVDLALGTRLVQVDSSSGGGTLLTLQPSAAEEGTDGVTVHAGHLVNASGLGSRAVADLYDGAVFDINPRRGQFLVYDRQASSLLTRILLPLPTKQTKGMLVAPTIFGNVISGPTAEDLPLDMANNPSTTVEGLEFCRSSGHEMLPALAEQPPIASYAGMRCHCEQGSYHITFNDGTDDDDGDGDGASRVATVTGVRSTGFTASAALATYLVEGLAREQGLVLVRDESAVDSRPADRMPGWWGAMRREEEEKAKAEAEAAEASTSVECGWESLSSDMRPHDDATLMSSRPDYGNILCSCENVSEGEIIDALRSPLKANSLDAIKRRTRALTGRCQSFNCMVPIAEVIAKELDIPLHQVTKCGPGTEIAVGPVSSKSQSIVPEPEPEQEPQRVDVPKVSYQVVVVGAGPAGVGAACALVANGVPADEILVVDRAQQIGGIPRRYGHSEMASFVQWNRARVVSGGVFADELAEALAKSGVHVQKETHVKQLLKGEGESGNGSASCECVLVSAAHGRLSVTAGAVVLACGAREAGPTERGSTSTGGGGDGGGDGGSSAWVAGSRTSRVFHTTHILDMLGSATLPSLRPVVLGSDLVAYGSAAKLHSSAAASASTAVMADSATSGAKKSWLEPLIARLYFSSYAPTPTWRGSHAGATLLPAADGTRSLGGVRLEPANGGNGTAEHDDVDSVLIAGRLVPNSELLMQAGTGLVELPSRKPVTEGMSSGAVRGSDGWLVVGNICGWDLPAQWCGLHGAWVGRKLAKTLQQRN